MGTTKVPPAGSSGPDPKPAAQQQGATIIEARRFEADGMAVQSLFDAAAVTEIYRIVLLSGSSRFEVSVLPHGEPTHELTTDPDGRMRLHSLAEEGNSSDLSWRADDDGFNGQLREKLASICNSRCVIQVSQVAATDATAPLLTMLRTLQQATPSAPAVEIYVNLSQRDPRASAAVCLRSRFSAWSANTSASSAAAMRRGWAEMQR